MTLTVLTVVGVYFVTQFWTHWWVSILWPNFVTFRKQAVDIGALYNRVMEKHHLYLLAVSLLIGLLIGLERGWQAREAKEGARIAGIRTFALMGLLGGITGLISTVLGPMAFGFIFLGFSALVAYIYGITVTLRSDVGITSLVAALITFLLGCLASLGFVLESASAAIVVTFFLRLKPVLHQWLKQIEANELIAILELLLISVVLLGVLPNEGYGPWQSLNPFEIWWMVVLVATLSFLGYFAIKLTGARKGILFTALCGGLISSTLLTLHFSKLARAKKEFVDLLSMGILLACGMMFFRMLFFVFILRPDLIMSLIVPVSLMGTWLILISLVLWRKTQSQVFLPQEAVLKNPLELKSALFFGALLTLVIFLVTAIKETVGVTGLYAFSALSGLIDIDAITLSLIRLKTTPPTAHVLVVSILIAGCANTILKAALAWGMGGKPLLIRTTLPLLSAVVLGLVIFLIHLYLA